MWKRINVNVGEQYGRLIIICEASTINGVRYFKCKCDCGKVVTIALTSLRNKATKSCGCLRIEQNKTSGIIHGKYNTRLYGIWHGMKQRCDNPNCRAYKWYGAKGITVCREWNNDIMTFYNWAITSGYDKTLTIDRINNNEGYFPDNCKWSTRKQQSRNKAKSKLFTFRGKTLCVTDWAIEMGLSRQAMNDRLKSWPLEKALTQPVIKKYQHYVT